MRPELSRRASDAQSGLRAGLARLVRRLADHGGAVAAGAALVLVLGGAAYSAALGPGLRYPDESEYLTLAVNLAEGRGLTADGRTPTAYRPPGYPAFMTPVVAAGGGVVALRILNFALLAGCVGLVWLLLRRHGHPLAAALAPLGLVAYPVLSYTAGTLYPQTLGAFGLLAMLVLLAREPARWWSLAAAGLVLGGLVLTIPMMAFLMVTVAGWLLLRRPPRSASGAVFLLLPAVLLVGAWSLRNEAAVGAPVFISSNSGLNLLLGNSENTTPNAGVNVDIRPQLREAEPLGEVDRDELLRDRALDWMAAHPLEAGGLYVRKVANYFNYRNELFVRSESTSLADLALAASYGALLTLVLARLFLARRRPLSRLEGLLVSTYALSVLATAIAFTRIRFRVPFDVLLILEAAILLELAAGALLRYRTPGETTPGSAQAR